MKSRSITAKMIFKSFKPAPVCRIRLHTSISCMKLHRLNTWRDTLKNIHSAVVIGPEAKLEHPISSCYVLNPQRQPFRLMNRREISLHEYLSYVNRTPKISFDTHAFKICRILSLQSGWPHIKSKGAETYTPQYLEVDFLTGLNIETR